MRVQKIKMIAFRARFNELTRVDRFSGSNAKTLCSSITTEHITGNRITYVEYTVMFVLYTDDISKKIDEIRFNL